MFNVEDCVQVDSLLNDLISFLIVLHLAQVLKGRLKHESIGKSSGEGLDLIRHLIHPHIKERFAFLHDLLLQQLSKRLDQGLFSVVNQVSDGLKTCNRLQLGNLADRAHSQLRHLVLLLLHVGQDVLDHLLHEDAVVSLGSHARVSTGNAVGND